MNRDFVKRAIQRVKDDTNEFRLRNKESRVEIIGWRFDEKDNTVEISMNDEPPTRFCNTLSSLSFVSSELDVWQDDELANSSHRMWHVRVPVSKRNGEISRGLERLFKYLSSGPLSKIFFAEVALLVVLICATVYFSLVVIYDIFFY
jgi:hypothetical protein